MLDARFIRENLAAVRQRLATRGAEVSLDAFVAADAERRRILGEVEARRAELNRLSKQVGEAVQRREDATEPRTKAAALGPAIQEFDARLKKVEAQIEELLLAVPNLPHASVPLGRDGAENVQVRRWGTPREFPFAPRPHWEIGEGLGILDLERAAKVAQSRFPLLRGAGARLERALIAFMLDLHTREHGYLEWLPPLLVNRDCMVGTGQLPKFGEELYHAAADDLFLIPTAEVPVTNVHRDDILDGAALPIAYTAWTPCFRREAGAHGKDTRGLIRVHQFDKVELVRFCRPEESGAEHERMTRHAETILERLEIPYRVLELAAGDLGFASARTLDLEAWAGGVGAWLEVSSSSCFTDFQARRAGIRFRPEVKAKPELVHTLNASALAFPRTIIALLENNQAADGSVRVPAALAPYLGSDRLVPRA